MTHPDFETFREWMAKNRHWRYNYSELPVNFDPNKKINL